MDEDGASTTGKNQSFLHCVIIGFSVYSRKQPVIYDYVDPSGEPQRLFVSRINPYLLDAEDTLLVNRKHPISDAPDLRFGSMPRDGGNLIFDQQEYEGFVNAQPQAKSLVKQYVGADEFISGKKRYCLWLFEVSPTTYRALPEVMARLDATRSFREASKAASTRAFAATPGLFCQIAQPNGPYLAIPAITSQRRTYVPLGFMSSDVIANNKLYVAEGATVFHFGVLSSEMHMSWMRYTCGRMKSDFSYSRDIVYNNFPWPELAVPSPAGRRGQGEGGQPDESPSPGAARRPLPPAGEASNGASEEVTATTLTASAASKHRQAIEAAAQGVLDARAQFPDAMLADLYDPLTMPPALVKAHQQLDRAVDAAYLAAEKAAGRPKPNLATDAERVAFLFQRYQAITSLLPVEKAKTPRRKKSGG